MPNYPTHARWGRIGAVGMAVVVGGGLFAVFGAPVLAVVGALGAGVSTFVGAIFPDIDHHKSIPRRKAVRAVRVLVWVGVVSLAILSWDVLVDIVDATLVGPSEAALSNGIDYAGEIPSALVASTVVFLGASVLAGLVNPTIGFVTDRHRGWTHSVPVTFLLTLAIAGILWILTGEMVAAALALERRLAAVTVAFTFFVGVLVHLGLDGEIV